MAGRVSETKEIHVEIEVFLGGNYLYVVCTGLL